MAGCSIRQPGEAGLRCQIAAGPFILLRLNILLKENVSRPFIKK
jgi:hypothetical protein